MYHIMLDSKSCQGTFLVHGLHSWKNSLSLPFLHASSWLDVAFWYIVGVTEAWWEATLSGCAIGLQNVKAFWFKCQHDRQGSHCIVINWPSYETLGLRIDAHACRSFHTHKRLSVDVLYGPHLHLFQHAAPLGSTLMMIYTTCNQIMLPATICVETLPLCHLFERWWINYPSSVTQSMDRLQFVCRI